MTNANILLQNIRGGFTPGENRRRAQQSVNADLQTSVNALGFRKGMQDMQRAEQARSALQSANIDWTQPDAYNQAAGALGSIAPMRAAEFAEKGRGAQKSQMDLKKAELDVVGAKLDTFSKLFNPAVVNSQETWDAAVQAAQSYGLNAGGLAGQAYSPELVQGIALQALDAKDALAANLAERKFTETKRHNLAIEKKPSMQSTVIFPPEETEEMKAVGKARGTQFANIVERGFAAQDELYNLEILKGMDVPAGATEPMQEWLGKFALGIGVPEETLQAIGIEKVAGMQAFIGVAQNLVLTKMQAQKGPQTESDAKRIERTVAQLGNTPEARDFLLNAAIALRTREIKMAEFYDSRQGAGKKVSMINAEWRDWKRRNKLISSKPSPITGLPLFYEEFANDFRLAFPDATEDEILKSWRENYAK